MRHDPVTRKNLVADLNVEPLLDSLLHVQLAAVPMQRVIGTPKLSRIAFYGLVQEAAKHAMLAKQYAKRMEFLHKNWGK